MKILPWTTFRKLQMDQGLVQHTVSHMQCKSILWGSVATHCCPYNA